MNGMAHPSLSTWLWKFDSLVELTGSAVVFHEGEICKLCIHLLHLLAVEYLIKTTYVYTQIRKLYDILLLLWEVVYVLSPAVCFL